MSCVDGIEQMSIQLIHSLEYFHHYLQSAPSFVWVNLRVAGHDRSNFRDLLVISTPEVPVSSSTPLQIDKVILPLGSGSTLKVDVQYTL